MSCGGRRAGSKLNNSVPELANNLANGRAWKSLFRRVLCLSPGGLHPPIICSWGAFAGLILAAPAFVLCLDAQFDKQVSGSKTSGMRDLGAYLRL